MNPPIATAADIEWIDRYGHALVCGHRIHRTDILALETIHDRRSDGHLTAAAREKIAANLTFQLQERDDRALAAWEAAHGKPAFWHDCDG